MTSSKKHDKIEFKLAKKRAKAEAKSRKQRTPEAGHGHGPSPAVRYAESIRGILYVVSGVSLMVALLLGQRGAIVSLDDVIESLFAARVGKILLAMIGLALLIYGLKHLRLMR